MKEKKICVYNSARHQRRQMTVPFYLKAVNTELGRNVFWSYIESTTCRNKVEPRNT